MSLNHYINGKWIEGCGPIFHSIDPATGLQIFETRHAKPSEIESAINAAKEAQILWQYLALDTRIDYLNKFRLTLELKREELVKAISQETGKPLWESDQEVQSMINKIPISIDAYAQRCPQKKSALATGMSFTRHKPHGVLAVLGPFNFPGHLPNGHIVPALLAGNTIVFKPSELTPLAGHLMAQYWDSAQLPAGVFNLVQGGKETGQAITAGSGLNGLCFTGSWPTGKILLEQYATKPEFILALEMGGNNPLVVSKVSDSIAAVYITLQSAYSTAGQRCSCARRLIVIENNSSKEFVDKLVTGIQNIKIGTYTDSPEPFMGPVITHQTARAILDKQASLEKLGGKPLIKSRLLKENTGFLTPGLIDVTSIKNLSDEEIFGPLLQLIYVADFETALMVANQTQYGLSAGLLSDDPKEYEKFYQTIKAGVVNWNAPLTGASSSAPFGGLGKSGNHRPSAYYAADYCSYPVASIESDKLTFPKQLPPGLLFNNS